MNKSVKPARPEQIAICQAIFAEAERQGLDNTAFAELAGKTINSIRLTKRYSNIGMHLMLDFAEALDVQIMMVNRDGLRIL